MSSNVVTHNNLFSVVLELYFIPSHTARWGVMDYCSNIRPSVRLPVLGVCSKTWKVCYGFHSDFAITCISGMCGFGLLIGIFFFFFFFFFIINFLTELSVRHTSIFCFRMITWVSVNVFLSNLAFAFTLRRCGFGLVILSYFRFQTITWVHSSRF